ncbi:MAG: transporter [Pseudomonadota bacterium]|nr:transporter [Pseudomonadota bacterium]
MAGERDNYSKRECIVVKLGSLRPLFAASVAMSGFGVASVANAQTEVRPANSEAEAAGLRQALSDERAELDRQYKMLEAQRTRIEALEARLGTTGTSVASTPSTLTPGSVPLPNSPPPAPPVAVGQNGPRPGNAVQPVGEAPSDQRQVQVAVLSEQGGIITKAGRLTIEGDLEYARADRNQVVFRGVQIPEAVLIGVFDINESRQDILTAAVVARLGITSRFEINGRLPYVYRSDKSVLAPVANPMSPNAGQIDRPVTAGNIGDIDFGVRYQITNGSGTSPYLIAGVQAVAPTGTDPFTVPRDALGNALTAATGAGFWGVTPNLTAILPSDPAVLFATIGYTRNFGRDINQQIGATLIERVRPGDAPSASAGIAISLNPRTSVSFGYSQTWAFGTDTRLRMLSTANQTPGPVINTRSRDLQLGRFLFGVSYRTSPKTTINWNVEVGATHDAANVRTSLRIPFTLNAFK